MKKNFFRISIIFVIILICFLSSCKSCNNKNYTNNDDEQQENNENNNNQQNNPTKNPQINVDKLNIELLPNETYELNITLEDADVENIEYNFVSKQKQIGC